jgi:HD-GYP domain-containing protein (c-di-GMP phosphodiesterase class II)
MMAAALHVTGMQHMPEQLVEELPDGASSRSPVFRQYPEAGAQQLEQCGGFPPEVVRIVREHRERPDGTGFPRGLAGDAIHPLALVLGAIREFQVQCAMEGATPAQALAHVYRNLRSVFGDETINHLIASMTVYPPGTYVLLSDGSIGRVLRVNEGNRLRPVVGLFGESTDLADAEILDLSIVQDLSIQRFVDVTLLPRRLVEQLRRTWTGVALAPLPEDERAA